MESGYLNTTGQGGDKLQGPVPEIVPLTESLIPLYLKTGRKAYSQYYCHLWPGGNPDPYLNRNFTATILLGELADPRYICWLLFYKGEAAGICQMDLKKECRFHPAETSLFIEKIYFRKGFTGLGLGGGIFREIKRRALGMEKDFLWLKTMQKGQAFSFYEHIGFNILAETQIPYPEVLESEKKMWVLGLHLG